MSHISKRKVHTGQCILARKQIDAMLDIIGSKCQECTNTSVYCGLCDHLLDRMSKYRVTGSYVHKAKLFCMNFRRDESIITIYNDSEERALKIWEGY